ncbi:major vault protein [Salpingoeca rosetta]|uniref:Major vault protein n=1 Tax=Salpingoeca rosetta (strain ATCC 50818 / BSB-021) TaxID=946362 RepID=F2UN76_SALR5|nr:major vault protein [Salpingoeca rosetta]EGD78575.1 major vault protein [Salpingoeca rosetta]|eukprot:XP_004989524.1 major vault protein [Salpingoeca rosetta]
MSKKAGDVSIFRVPPFHYLHVLDQTSNVTRVVTGPVTFIRQENEVVLLGPEKMITIPPRHYCIVKNPVLRDDDTGEIVVDELSKQVKLRHSELEVRRTTEPFPLYPGEELHMPVTPLTVVPADSALHIQAILDFSDDDGNRRIAGDEWLFEGPGTYIPRVEEKVVKLVHAVVVLPNQALRLCALKETRDRDGNMRVTGEEWMVDRVGAYLPGVYEKVVDTVNSFVLTDKNALHLRATRSFKDRFGKERKTGEEWLITLTEAECYIPGVYEEVVADVDITTLSNRQYAVILNPVDAHGRQQLGSKKLVKGPNSFFLQPGEMLEAGVQDVYILGEDEGLILRSTETFTDTYEGKEVQRLPGDRWMIRGPAEYVPPVQVEVVQKREAIPLDDNEGIYVRDTKTGKVRAVIGQTYMLTQDEELYHKELPQNVEELLASQRDPLADRSSRKAGGAPAGPRDKTRVISFRVPHNAAVQVYDYKEKQARVSFGPDLVMLGPDEQFTVISLSGGKPKRPNQIRSLCLLLGPDFCTDIVQIETADHARLHLQVSYNWEFEVDKTSAEDAARLFAVPDFVGDMCKAVASRIRGAVAQVQFDDFHKNSARIIRASVFGTDDQKRVRQRFVFPANGLSITNIDIQSAEPVDQRTRDALQKSVQLAIEITTASQEATARHEAERREQAAKGALERQKIEDEAAAEEAKKSLLELQAQSAAVESTGQAKAEAQSRAEAARIEGEAAVDQARLKSEAMNIESEGDLDRLQKAREAELDFIRKQNDLELEKQQRMNELEIEKFQKMVSAITPQALCEMARAGPEMQAKLLGGLGISSTLITDGSSPINLFNAASGLIGIDQGKQQQQRK